MTDRPSAILWKRVLWGGTAVAVLTLFVVLSIIIVYAMALSGQNQGKAIARVDIESFGRSASKWAGSIASILLTMAFAEMIAKKARRARALNGLLLGLAASTIGLGLGLALGGTISLATSVKFGLTTATGWLTGMLVRGREAKRSVSLE